VRGLGLPDHVSNRKQSDDDHNFGHIHHKIEQGSLDTILCSMRSFVANLA